MSDKHGNTLSWDEFCIIMRIIDERHSFGRCSLPAVKYVRPSIDMRTRDIFYVVFDAYFDDREFDFRDSEESMFDRVMCWLGYAKPYDSILKKTEANANDGT